MKHYIDIPLPATTRTQLDRTTCDLCGTDAPNGSDGWSKRSSGWSDIDEVTISRDVGYACDGGKNTEEIFVDMCPACFTTKLLPWLKSQGAKVQTRDSGY